MRCGTISSVVCGSQNPIRGTIWRAYQIGVTAQNAAKPIKVAQTAIGLVNALGHRSPGLDYAQKTMGTTNAFLNLARAPVQGMRAAGNLRIIIDQVTSFGSDRHASRSAEGPWLVSVAEIERKDQLKQYADIATTNTEKGLAIVAETFSLGSNVPAIASGFHSIFQFSRACGAQVPPFASQLSKQMPKVMFPAHISSVLYETIRLIFAHKAYNRLLGGLTADQSKTMFRAHVKNTLTYSLGLLKSTADVVGDVALFTPVSALFRAIAALCSAIFDLLKLLLPLKSEA